MLLYIGYILKDNVNYFRKIILQWLIKRDGNFCYHCRKKLNLKLKWPNRFYVVPDHIISKLKGGTDNLNNLRALHQSCNSSLSDKSYTKTKKWFEQRSKIAKHLWCKPEYRNKQKNNPRNTGGHRSEISKQKAKNTALLLWQNKSFRKKHSLGMKITPPWSKTKRRMRP